MISAVRHIYFSKDLIYQEFSTQNGLLDCPTQRPKRCAVEYCTGGRHIHLCFHFTSKHLQAYVLRDLQNCVSAKRRKGGRHDAIMTWVLRCTLHVSRPKLSSQPRIEFQRGVRKTSYHATHGEEASIIVVQQRIVVSLKNGRFFCNFTQQIRWTIRLEHPHNERWNEALSPGHNMSFFNVQIENVVDSVGLALIKLGVLYRSVLHKWASSAKPTRSENESRHSTQSGLNCFHGEGASFVEFLSARVKIAGNPPVINFFWTCTTAVVHEH